MTPVPQGKMSFKGCAMLKKTQSKRSAAKTKRPRGRPEKTYNRRLQYDEKGFFEAVRERFTEKELTIFKTSRERLKALSEEWCGFDDLYPRDEKAISDVVGKIKDSAISVGYIQECLRMSRVQYYEFLRLIKMDAAGADSILAGKGYGIARYFRERYEVRGNKAVKKPGVKDDEVTFEHFEDLVKIAIYEWGAL